MNGIAYAGAMNYQYMNPGVTNVLPTGANTGVDTAGKVETSGGAKGATECQTCENRKYQDGSNEMVSFKSAQHISPMASASRVRAHEQEHVSNAFTKAAQDNGKVLQASVTLKTAVCPECGRTYVAGGETTTKIKYENEENPYVEQLKKIQGDALRGQNFDVSIK